MPITSRKELTQLFHPFQPFHASCVLRQNRNIELAAPLKKNVICGFNNKTAMKSEKLSNHTINHHFPWVPANDDWTDIIKTLLSQLDPCQMIIRLNPTSPKISVY